ncbi:MAG: hypothetical protein K2X08_00565 [Chlamydiales bacterium]|nr:hypothetical protein [Chlamydiales bacterium]
MKPFMKGALLVFMGLFCSQAMANEALQEKTIWKLFQIDTQVDKKTMFIEFDKKAILISDDYEIWLLHGLRPNALTWNEWIWREEVPQPDASYFFDVIKWAGNRKVFIAHTPWQSCEWQSSYRNDTSLLQHCEYVIVNSAYDARVFAKPIQIDEWISLYNALDEEVEDLVNGGFFGHAATLLESKIAFIDFKQKILIELLNKEKGDPFDEKYIEFNEKYGLFQLDNSH